MLPTQQMEETDLQSMGRQQRQVFQTLDGLRGIAALLIILRHAGALGAGASLPESFLAVDLFFLLSGFVIAFAYDKRLAQPGFIGRFLVIRLIRLYPLYLLGLAVGAIYRFGSVLNHTENWTIGHLVFALVLGMLLVPTTPITGIGSSELDTPTWTLLPELIANILYAILFRWLTRPVLMAIVGIGVVCVVVCRLYYGTLDAGWEFASWPIIISRLLFSFFAGVLLFRVLGDRRRIQPWAAWLCVASVGVALSTTPYENIRVFYELGLVLGVFPLVVWVGCQTEPGQWSGRLFHFLGLISYAIYVLHQPAGALFAKFLEKGAHLDLNSVPIANTALVIFIISLMIATWLINKYYDVPVRRWLSGHSAQQGSSNILRPVKRS